LHFSFGSASPMAGSDYENIKSMKSKKSFLYYYSGALLAAIGLLFFIMFFLFDVAGFGDVGMGRLIENTPVLLTTAIFLIAAPIAAAIYARNEQKAELVEYMSRSVIRYVVAYLMCYYGYAKMRHKFFDITYISQDSRLSEIDNLSLVWYFFGRSNVQEFLIGLMEFVPGILIFFRRTSFVGCILLFPVAMNVLLVNTFNHVSSITFPLSIFIVLSNIYLLYGHKQAIVQFLRNITEQHGPALNKFLDICRWLFKLAVVGTIGYLLFATLILKHGKANYSQRNKFMGGFELSQLKVNDSVIHPDAGNTQYYKSIYIEPQSRWNCVRTFVATPVPRAITIRWSSDNDSVVTALKKFNDVTMDRLDSSTMFIGTYHLSKDTLFVKGRQYGKTINAKYTKKELTDYKWFW
jgi:hypothetical protein